MANLKYFVEDALQIDHGTSPLMEVFEPLVPEAEWKGMAPDVMRKTEDYYSDDEIIEFESLDKEAYAAKVGSPAGIPEDEFPVLVVVRKPR